MNPESLTLNSTTGLKVYEVQISLKMMAMNNDTLNKGYALISHIITATNIWARDAIQGELANRLH